MRRPVSGAVDAAGRVSRLEESDARTLRQRAWSDQ